MMSSDATGASNPGVSDTGSGAQPTRVIDSQELFADQKEIQIRHAGEIYRLRLTRNGRLILNK